MDTRKVIFSSDIFHGYTVTIDISQYSSLVEVVDICVADIYQTLLDYNFEILLEKMQEKNFHIHNFSNIEEIRRSRADLPIYICDH